MTAAAQFRARYYGAKIDEGIYVQPHDDGERVFVVVRQGKTWAWGPITLEDHQRIGFRSGWDPEGALERLTGLATETGYRTKSEAIESAMKREWPR